MTPAGVRAVLRIAGRNVGRNRWRSLLVGLLVVLPVAGMVAGVTFLRTTTPSIDEQWTSTMGVADVRVVPLSPSASGQDLRRRLPPGSRVEPVRETPDVLVLPGRRMDVTLRATDIGGLAHGMVTLTAGRAPTDTTEVALSAALATAAGLAIDDAITLEQGGRATVVGIVDSPLSLSSRFVLQHPTLAERPGHVGPGLLWLATVPNGEYGVDLGQDYKLDVRGWSSGPSSDMTPLLLVFGGLALIETVLVAAAAFAVSIRRRQRELGIMAAAGAQPRHLAGTVLGEGLLVGGLAAAVGIVLGVAAVVSLLPWLDQLTDRRTPGVVVDVVAIALAASVGVAAAVVAAAIPAWSAARMPPLLSLSGRRPPSGSARRTLLLGAAMVGASVVLTASGASSLLGGEHSMASAMLVGGAMLGMLGFGAVSPWLVAQLERLGVRLPLVPRIALRDASRARSRTAPLVTAMLASLAMVVAISATTISTAASQEASWQPWLRADQILLSGDGALAAGPEVARQMNAVAAAPLLGLASLDGAPRVLLVHYTHTGETPTIGPDNYVESGGWAYRATIGSEELLRAMGAQAAIEDFRQGKVIVFPDPPIALDTVALEVSRAIEWPDYTDWQATHAELAPAATARIGIAAHSSRLIGAVLPPALAERLGFGSAYTAAEAEYLIRLDHAVSEAGDVARAAELVADHPGTYAAGAFAPRVATEGVRLAAFLLSVLLALTVTAIAVALGEAEARPDQRTLLAVGADPRVRRRIVAARAGVMALLACLLAVPAGLLPAWGLVAARPEQFLVVPVPEIVAIVALLPLVAMACAFLLSRPIPHWSAFRDVGPG